ncbi:hypothetical protein CPB84DRAFT_1756851 [Gymnopilus junonius]|uniref:Uncharacterized protein n=1 Tax=Gymnopilus junonius TaxID=109634 RepID=A0A9P5N7K4_GYMJU|nr:hypothetical protein CPB84DRAFT_1756851 [Gymnopilus junonius]
MILFSNSESESVSITNTGNQPNYRPPRLVGGNLPHSMAPTFVKGYRFSEKSALTVFRDLLDREAYLKIVAAFPPGQQKDIVFVVVLDESPDEEALKQRPLAPLHPSLKQAMLLGPFTAAQLETRSHKPNPSGDYAETFKIRVRKLAEPDFYPMHLLGTREAAKELENFIQTTSHFL